MVCRSTWHWYIYDEETNPVKDMHVTTTTTTLRVFPDNNIPLFSLIFCSFSFLSFFYVSQIHLDKPKNQKKDNLDVGSY